MHPVQFTTKLLIKPNLFKPLPMKPTKYCSTWFYRVSHKHRSGGESTAPTTAAGTCRDGGEQLVTSGENSLHHLISTYQHLKQSCRLLCPYPLPYWKEEGNIQLNSNTNMYYWGVLWKQNYVVWIVLEPRLNVCPCMPNQGFSNSVKVRGEGGTGLSPKGRENRKFCYGGLNSYGGRNLRWDFDHLNVFQS